MTSFRYIVLTVLLLPLLSYGQKPKSIEEAIAYFENTWSDEDKIAYKNMSEDTAAIRLHFSTGMWMRNKWMWCCPNSPLAEEFNTYDIFHPDDMSSIILLSLHRKLNNKPLGIKEQAEKHAAYWKKAEEYQKSVERQTAQNYQRFRVGDSIRVYLYVDTARGQRQATYLHPHDWEFDPKKDILISGVVTRKYSEMIGGDRHFVIKVVDVNFNDVPVFTEPLNPGDKRDFMVHLLKIR